MYVKQKKAGIHIQNMKDEKSIRFAKKRGRYRPASGTRPGASTYTCIKGSFLCMCLVNVCEVLYTLTR